MDRAHQPLAQRDDLNAPTRIAWLSGQTSRRARQEFTAQGWKIEESYRIGGKR